MELDVEDDRIVAVRGDRDHPLTQGYFCVKGLASVDFHNGVGRDLRLLSSMRRNSSGAFQEIEADRAVDEIAERLKSVIARFGAKSVAVWTGTASYMGSQILLTQGLIKSLMQELGTPYLFSGMTLDQSAKWVTMSRMGVFATGKRDMHQLDAMMLIGANPVVSHQGAPINSASGWNPAKAIRSFRDRGGVLIVVDPRLTETAKLADIHLQIIPGQDAALMAGLVKIVLDQGGQDEAFCDRFVDNLAALSAAVAPFDLDVVARRTGIPAASIQKAAETLIASRRVSVSAGTGHNMGPNCNLAEHLTEALNAICGGYRRAGESLGTPGLVNANPKTEKVYPPYRSWMVGPRLTSENAGRMLGEFPSALLPQAILEKQIRALIVIGGNPAMAIGDPDKTGRALQELEILVTVDPRMTETALLSDYVVAPALPFERHDVPILTESWAPVPFLQYAEPVMKKPPGVIEDWAFIWGIANRLGIQLTLKNAPYGADYAVIPGGLELDKKIMPDTENLLAWALSNSPISYDELKSLRGAAASVVVAATIVEAVEEGDDARLDLWPDDVAKELEMFAAEAPTSGFRYLLCCRRLLENMNSAFRLGEKSQARYGGSPLFMNPDDISETGLAEGQIVTIQADHGAIRGRVRKDAALRRGVVSMTHHWAAMEEAARGHTGQLVSIEASDLAAISFMPRQSAIPVNIAPVAL